MLQRNTLFLCLLILGISTYSQHVEIPKDSVYFQDSVINDNVAELDFNVADKEEYYKVSKLEKQYTKTLLFEERYHKLQRTEGIDCNYFLPIFSVNPGENLKITGKFVSNAENVDASTIKFMTTEGVVLTSKYDAATKVFTLTLSPSAVGNSQRYFAVAEHQISTSLNVPNKKLVLGGFEVMTYPEKSVTLTLVPVNKIGETNNPIDKNSIEKYLNKAYGVANVKFNVKLAESFDYNGETKFMVNEKSRLLEEYTPAMLAMNNAYLEKVGDNFDKNSLYLFLLNFGAGSNDMAGFMPRQSQIGYIFLNNNRVVERTIAHELEHGLAAMSHTFNAKYGSITEGTTNNLMDYGDGIALQKHQWDLLHSKVVVWKVFERDKEGMQKKIPINTADEQSIFLAAQLFKEYIVGENIKPKDFNYQNLSSEKKYEFLRRYEQGKTADVFRTMSDNQHYLEHRQGEEQIYANFIYELFDRITTVESLIEIPFYQEKLVQILKGEYLQEIFSPDITGTILSLGASNNWTPQKYFTNNNGKWISTSRGKITSDDFQKVVAKLEGKGAGTVGISTGTKLLPQFASSTIDDAVSYAMKNKVTHIFGKVAHNLEPLVTKLGGHENTFRTVLNAANGKLPSSGIFNNISVSVGGYNVIIRGSVVNGVPRIGTMFIP